MLCTWESRCPHSYYQTLSCTAYHLFTKCFARVASSFSPTRAIHACKRKKIGNLKSSERWLQTKVMSDTNFDPFAIYDQVAIEYCDMHVYVITKRRTDLVGRCETLNCVTANYCNSFISSLPEKFISTR